jgi:NADPH:quinone reductase-like Zn-dependent oxidoreductase
MIKGLFRANNPFLKEKHMKAMRLIQPGQPLEMQQIPVPQIGPKDVLVRVKPAGVCHSDAHYRAGLSLVEPLPLTLGHKVAGRLWAGGGGSHRPARRDRDLPGPAVQGGGTHRLLRAPGLRVAHPDRVGAAGQAVFPGASRTFPWRPARSTRPWTVWNALGATCGWLSGLENGQMSK